MTPAAQAAYDEEIAHLESFSGCVHCEAGRRHDEWAKHPWPAPHDICGRKIACSAARLETVCTCTAMRKPNTTPEPLRPLERLDQAICNYQPLENEHTALANKLWPDGDEAIYGFGPNWKEYLPSSTPPADIARYEELAVLLNEAGEEFHAALNAYSAAPETERVAARLAEAVRADPGVLNIVEQNKWYRARLVEIAERFPEAGITY